MGWLCHQADPSPSTPAAPLPLPPLLLSAATAQPLVPSPPVRRLAVRAAVSRSHAPGAPLGALAGWHLRLRLAAEDAPRQRLVQAGRRRPQHRHQLHHSAIPHPRHELQDWQVGSQMRHQHVSTSRALSRVATDPSPRPVPCRRERSAAPRRSARRRARSTPPPRTRLCARCRRPPVPLSHGG
jgi:hypothetical protein